jgi:hypothetical protein
VNCTDCPVVGEVGLYVNEAARDVPTTMARAVVFEDEPFMIVNVTV